ncbi:MAG: hypothetical protein IPM97_14935 [Bdellovibrionaceae bacterium]|nr:hypothetical protein [Pseudobdellovibrionaceae bacterium]
MILNPLLSKTLVSIILMISFVESALGHGDDGIKEHKKEEKVAVRIVPSKSSILDSLSIEQILKSKQVPDDVLIVTCSLSTAPCRGIAIGLFDSNGSQIFSSNTGLNGFVGFQGLNKEDSYTARIKSEKYIGEVIVRSGVNQSLVGVRK